MLRMDQMHVIRDKVLREGSKHPAGGARAGLKPQHGKQIPGPVGAGAAQSTPAGAGRSQRVRTARRAAGRMGTKDDTEAAADRRARAARAA